MSANYDSTNVGVVYVRSTQVVINYPDGIGGTPIASITQSTAIKLADNSIRNLDAIQTLTVPLDFANHGTDPIPLVNPTSGANLGANTTLNNVYLQMLAIVRQVQMANNPSGSTYNASSVGVPYIRGTQLVINLPDSLGGAPSAIVTQCNAVPLANGTVRNLDVITPIVTTLDFINHGADSIPLVNPTTGANLGITTNLNTIYVNVLAIVRQAQIASGQ